MALVNSEDKFKNKFIGRSENNIKKIKTRDKKKQKKRIFFIIIEWSYGLGHNLNFIIKFNEISIKDVFEINILLKIL